MSIDDRLQALKQRVVEPLPHPSVPELRAAAQLIQDWAFRHFETLPNQSIGRTASVPDMRTRLDRPPPATGRQFANILADFDEHIAPFAFRTNHPRFLAFIPGAPSFPSVLGDWLTAAANFFCGVWLEAAGPAQVESTVLDWFRQWLGMPESTRGVLTTGGSEANLIALVTAREHVPFIDRPRIVLYVADQRHWSVDRAAKIIGLSPTQVHSVPVDNEFRVRGVELERIVNRDRAAGLYPWAVVANAGATNTGTVDALDELADVSRHQGLWLHIDAAYGWVMALSERGRSDLNGIARANSVTLDPHKWLAQTFDTGCVLVRDGWTLPETFASRPDYLQDATPNEGEINYADHGIALTRRFRALKVWLSIQMLGLDWFRDLADHCCALAAYAEARLASAGTFEILCPRRLSIVCFRYAPAEGSADLDQLNGRLVEALRATGRAFLSSTRLNGTVAIRMCFINWRTTADDVDLVVDLLSELGSRITSGPVGSTFPCVPVAEDCRNDPAP